MKILLDHHNPFFLAHGGVQIQIENTKAALEQVGLQVEFVRWWDDQQTGDLIHFFGVASPHYIRVCSFKRIPMVMTSMSSETCNRPDWRINLQAAVTRCVLGFPIGETFKNQLNWRSYTSGVHNVVGLEAEKRILQKIYGVSGSDVSVVPLGVSDTFLTGGQGQRSGDFLISVGTITEVKNSIDLAKLAKEARVPLLFVGRPYQPGSSYWKMFESLIDGKHVKYRPHIDSELELASLLKQARGFVLNSRYENWCLAAHEAAACGLPLLLPDAKWSKERFGTAAIYFSKHSRSQNIETLRRFYEESEHLSAPSVRLFSWREVADRLKAIYESLPRTSR